jgi:hypothetical protein
LLPKKWRFKHQKNLKLFLAGNKNAGVKAFMKLTPGV